MSPKSYAFALNFSLFLSAISFRPIMGSGCQLFLPFRFELGWNLKRNRFKRKRLELELIFYLSTNFYFCQLSFCRFFIIITILLILNKEKILKQGLPGYSAYCEKVRYRLVPFVW